MLLPFLFSQVLGIWTFLLFLGGSMKLHSPKAFKLTLMRIPYAKPLLTSLITWTLPMIELIIAFGLLTEYWIFKAASITLCTCFIIVSCVVLAKNLDIECNCLGGLDESTFSMKTIMLNAIFMVTLFLSIVVDKVQVDLFHVTSGGALVLLVKSMIILNNNNKDILKLFEYRVVSWVF